MSISAFLACHAMPCNTKKLEIEMRKSTLKQLNCKISQSCMLNYYPRDSYVITLIMHPLLPSVYSKFYLQ